MRSWPSETQVLDGLLDRAAVVDGDAREAEVVVGRVDEHRREPALAQADVVLVVGRGLRVQAAGEDDARDLVLEQHVHVVRLGDAGRGARAQHRGEAALGERVGDHLGEGREDRVLQLGQHEPDEAGSLAAKLGRTLVAEHVEGGEDELLGRLRDAGLLVEDTADGRLADARVLRDLGQPARHAVRLSQESDSPYLLHTGAVDLRASAACTEASFGS